MNAYIRLNASSLIHERHSFLVISDSTSYIFVLSSLNLALTTEETELRMKSTTAQINKHGNGSLMDWFQVRVLLTFVRRIKFQVKACNLSLQDNHSFSKSEEL